MVALAADEVVDIAAAYVAAAVALVDREVPPPKRNLVSVKNRAQQWKITLLDQAQGAWNESTFSISPQ